MKKLFVLFTCLLAIVPCLAQNPKVLLETNFGDIIIELYADDANETVDNFLHYVADDFYDGLIFHRVLSGFMIQGGGYDEDMNEMPTRDPIVNENSNGLKNDRGTIAMARKDHRYTTPPTTTSQFCIDLVDNDFLNLGDPNAGGDLEGYCVFGEVIEGMDVVDIIGGLPTDSSDLPLVPPGPAIIFAARILGDFEGDNKTDIIDYSFLAEQWGNSSLPQKLEPSDGTAEDWFGYSVDIDGNYAIVGAIYDDDNGSRSGSAYVFKLEDVTWEQQAKLIASDGAAWDYFGYSVSISDDHVLIGAPDNDDRGAAYIFKRDGVTWTQEAKLTASDANAGDWFGGAVAVDANNIIIGAVGDDDANDYAGAVYIFEKPSGPWADANETIKLTHPNSKYRGKFGIRVDINGDYAIAGATEDDGSGSGNAIILKDNPMPGWGVYEQLDPGDPSAEMWFGYSVAIDSNGFAVAGAINDDPNGFDSGSVRTFTVDGAVWSEAYMLSAWDVTDGDNLGYSVAIDGDYVISGAKYDDDQGGNSGAVYIFDGHIPVRKIIVDGGSSNDYLGHAVAADGGYAIAGAYQDNGTDSGAAYIFRIECPAADLNNDCIVDGSDLSLFIDNWLEEWTL